MEGTPLGFQAGDLLLLLSDRRLDLVHLLG